MPVAFGFLLLRAIDLPLPQTGPWEQLIARLVDSLDTTNDRDTHRGNPT